MGLKSNPLKNSQKGFSLVELMLVLALLGLVLAGIYQFFFFTNRTYANTESQSIAIQEANLFVNQIERDIRSASSPNEATDAVRVRDSGWQVDIYQYDADSDSYKLISYRLNPSDRTQLQKGSVSAVASGTIPGTAANPQYGGINTNAWKTISSNVANHAQEAALFTDVSDDQYVASERRRINIDLKILAPDTNRPVTVQTSALSRSGRSKSSIMASESIDIPATGIVLIYEGNTLDPGTTISTDYTAKSIYVTASVRPLTATARNVTWSENVNWIALASGTSNSGSQQKISIDKNGGTWSWGTWRPSGSREVTVTAKTANGKSVTFKILQAGQLQP